MSHPEARTAMEHRLPLILPPVDIVRHYSEMSKGDQPQLILDAGTGTGRNSYFLRNLGHTVVALDNDYAEVTGRVGTPSEDEIATPSGRQQSLFATRTHRVVADVRNLPFRQQSFDVALLNEVTHLLPKKDTWEAITSLQRVVKAGGPNIVSGYLAMPGRTNTKNSARCFHPGELRDIYTHAGWSVLFYEEEHLPNQYIGKGKSRREIIASRAKLIAQSEDAY